MPEHSTLCFSPSLASLSSRLRSPVAKERLETRPDGLVRITLKRTYADGTGDHDPPSRLCRLATNIPPPRLHKVKCAASSRARIHTARASQPSPRRTRLTPSVKERDRKRETAQRWLLRAPRGAKLGGAAITGKRGGLRAECSLADLELLAQKGAT